MASVDPDGEHWWAPSVRQLEHLALKSAVGRVRRSAADARRAQWRVLRGIVDAAADSEFGRRCRLRGVDSVESFRAAVPVSTREESSFDRARCIAGDADVLFAGRAVGVRVAAAVGSGSSGAANGSVAARSAATESGGPGGERIGDDDPGTASSAGPRSGSESGAESSAANGAAGGGLRPVRAPVVAATREPRLIVPISSRCRDRAARDASAAWFGRAVRQHPTMLDGPILVVPPMAPSVGGAGDGLTDARPGTRWSHLGDVLPVAVRRRLAVEPAAVAIVDPVIRARTIMRLAMARPVTALVGGTPADLAMLFQAADDVSERLIRDVRNGTLDVAEELEPAVRDGLAAHLEPDKQRARALERARSNRGGHLLPVDAWPLVVVGCLGQSRVANAGPAPATYLRPWLDPSGRGDHAAIHDLGWMTAEGWTTLGGPCDGVSEQAGAMPLADLAYHEFVDRRAMLDDPEQPERWTFIGLDELEPGVEYVDFVTTTGGLFRHETCDCVVRADESADGVRLAHVGRVEGIFASIP